MERFAIRAGMVLTSELRLRSRCRRYGKDEKLKLVSSPCKLAFDRLISATLPALLHDTPVQLHGLVLMPLVSDHEWRECFWRVDFHLKRASASDDGDDRLQETEMTQMNAKMIAVDFSVSMVAE